MGDYQSARGSQGGAEQIGVLIEKSWVPVPLSDATADQVAQSIRQVGAGRVYMTTDHGADYLKYPLEAMADFIVVMLDRGISSPQLRQMLTAVPEQVLDL